MNEHEPQVHEFEHSRLNRVLGRVGLVYGSGMAEFGLKHVGWGIPLHRRSTLESSGEKARAMMNALRAAEERSADTTVD
jgi:hypothetical protein